MRIKIGTRGSKLALAQSAAVRGALEKADPETEVETVVISTVGDRQDEAGGQMPGDGLFVREIEERLLVGDIDVAVHSLKDLPSSGPSGLVLAAVLPREDARDAFVSRNGKPLRELGPGARVATGSPRRRVQLLRRFPGIEIVPIRGNVDTRIRKVRENQADGVVLALAGLRRLNLEGEVSEIIPIDKCVPAPGQGAVVCQIRTDRDDIKNLVERIDDGPSARAVMAERVFLKALGGGCRAPIAAHARERAGTLELNGFVSDPDGRRFLEGTASGPPAEASELGAKLAGVFMARGARDLLAS